MRTDGYVYAPSALNLLKEPPVPTEKGPAWGAEQLWTIWKTELLL